MPGQLLPAGLPRQALASAGAAPLVAQAAVLVTWLGMRLAAQGVTDAAFASVSGSACVLCQGGTTLAGERSSPLTVGHSFTSSLQWGIKERGSPGAASTVSFRGVGVASSLPTGQCLPQLYKISYPECSTGLLPPGS